MIANITTEGSVIKAEHVMEKIAEIAGRNKTPKNQSEKCYEFLEYLAKEVIPNDDKLDYLRGAANPKILQLAESFDQQQSYCDKKRKSQASGLVQGTH